MPRNFYTDPIKENESAYDILGIPGNNQQEQEAEFIRLVRNTVPSDRALNSIVGLFEDSHPVRGDSTFEKERHGRNSDAFNDLNRYIRVKITAAKRELIGSVQDNRAQRGGPDIVIGYRPPQGAPRKDDHLEQLIDNVPRILTPVQVLSQYAAELSTKQRGGAHVFDRSQQLADHIMGHPQDLSAALERRGYTGPHKLTSRDIIAHLADDRNCAQIEERVKSVRPGLIVHENDLSDALSAPARRAQEIDSSISALIQNAKNVTKGFDKTKNDRKRVQNIIASADRIATALHEQGATEEEIEASLKRVIDDAAIIDGLSQPDEHGQNGFDLIKEAFRENIQTHDQLEMVGHAGSAADFLENGVIKHGQDQAYDAALSQLATSINTFLTDDHDADHKAAKEIISAIPRGQIQGFRNKAQQAIVGNNHIPAGRKDRMLDVWTMAADMAEISAKAQAVKNSLDEDGNQVDRQDDFNAAVVELATTVRDITIGETARRIRRNNPDVNLVAAPREISESGQSLIAAAIPQHNIPAFTTLVKNTIEDNGFQDHTRDHDIATIFTKAARRVGNQQRGTQAITASLARIHRSEDNQLNYQNLVYNIKEYIRVHGSSDQTVTEIAVSINGVEGLALEKKLAVAHFIDRDGDLSKNIVKQIHPGIEVIKASVDKIRRLAANADNAAQVDELITNIKDYIAVYGADAQIQEISKAIIEVKNLSFAKTKTIVEAISAQPDDQLSLDHKNTLIKDITLAGVQAATQKLKSDLDALDARFNASAKALASYIDLSRHHEPPQESEEIRGLLKETIGTSGHAERFKRSLTEAVSNNDDIQDNNRKRSVTSLISTVSREVILDHTIDDIIAPAMRGKRKDPDRVQAIVDKQNTLIEQIGKIYPTPDRFQIYASLERVTKKESIYQDERIAGVEDRDFSAVISTEASSYNSKKFKRELESLVEDGQSRVVQIDGIDRTIFRNTDHIGKKRRAYKALREFGDGNLLEDVTDPANNHNSLEEANTALDDIPVPFGEVDPNARRRAVFKALNELKTEAPVGNRTLHYVKDVMLLAREGGGQAHASLQEAEQAIDSKDRFEIRDLGISATFRFSEASDLEAFQLNYLVGNRAGIVGQPNQMKSLAATYSENYTQKALASQQLSTAGQLENQQRLQSFLDQMASKPEGDLERLQNIDPQTGEVNPALGTTSYKIKKAQDGNKTIYSITSIDYDEQGAAQEPIFSQAIIETDRRVRGFIGATQDQLNAGIVAREFSVDGDDNSITAFANLAGSVVNGSRQPIIPLQIQAAAGLQKTLENLSQISADQDHNYKLQGHLSDTLPQDNSFGYTITKAQQGNQTSWTVVRKQYGDVVNGIRAEVADSQRTSKIVFEPGKMIRAYFEKADAQVDDDQLAELTSEDTGEFSNMLDQITDEKARIEAQEARVNQDLRRDLTQLMGSSFVREQNFSFKVPNEEGIGNIKIKRDFTLQGDIFTVEQRDPDVDQPTYSKFKFGSNGELIAYCDVEAAQAIDQSLSVVTPNNVDEFRELIQQIQEARTYTEAVKSQSKATSITHITSALDNFAVTYADEANRSKLQNLPTLAQGVDGTYSYEVTKITPSDNNGQTTSYKIKKTHRDGDNPENVTYSQLVLRKGEKVQGFVAHADEDDENVELEPAQIDELTTLVTNIQEQKQAGKALYQRRDAALKPRIESLLQSEQSRTIEIKNFDDTASRYTISKDSQSGRDLILSEGFTLVKTGLDANGQPIGNNTTSRLKFKKGARARGFVDKTNDELQNASLDEITQATHRDFDRLITQFETASLQEGLSSLVERGKDVQFQHLGNTVHVFRGHFEQEKLDVFNALIRFRGNLDGDPLVDLINNPAGGQYGSLQDALNALPPLPANGVPDPDANKRAVFTSLQALSDKSGIDLNNIENELIANPEGGQYPDMQAAYEGLMTKDRFEIVTTTRAGVTTHENLSFDASQGQRLTHHDLRGAGMAAAGADQLKDDVSTLSGALQGYTTSDKSEVQSQSEPISALAKTLDDLARRSGDAKRSQLAELPTHDNAVAGTYSYIVTKTEPNLANNQTTTYAITRTHHDANGAVADTRYSQLVLQEGKKARGFIGQNDQNHQNALLSDQQLETLTALATGIETDRKTSKQDRLQRDGNLRDRLQTLLNGKPDKTIRIDNADNSYSIYAISHPSRFKAGDYQLIESKYTADGAETTKRTSKLRFNNSGRTQVLYQQSDDQLRGNPPLEYIDQAQYDRFSGLIDKFEAAALQERFVALVDRGEEQEFSRTTITREFDRAKMEAFKSLHDFNGGLGGDPLDNLLTSVQGYGNHATLTVARAEVADPVANEDVAITRKRAAFTALGNFARDQGGDLNQVSNLLLDDGQGGQYADVQEAYNAFITKDRYRITRDPALQQPNEELTFDADNLQAVANLDAKRQTVTDCETAYRASMKASSKTTAAFELALENLHKKFLRSPNKLKYVTRLGDNGAELVGDPYTRSLGETDRLDSYEVEKRQHEGKTTYVIIRSKFAPNSPDPEQTYRSEITFQKGHNPKGFIDEENDQNHQDLTRVANISDFITSMDALGVDKTRMSTGRQSQYAETMRTRFKGFEERLTGLVGKLGNSQSYNLQHPNGLSTSYDIESRTEGTVKKRSEFIVTTTQRDLDGNIVGNPIRQEFRMRGSRAIVRLDDDFAEITDANSADCQTFITNLEAAIMQSNLQLLVEDGGKKTIKFPEQRNEVIIERGTDDNGKRGRAFKAIQSLEGRLVTNVNLNRDQNEAELRVALGNLADNTTLADALNGLTRENDQRKITVINALTELTGDDGRTVEEAFDQLCGGYANLAAARQALMQEEFKVQGLAEDLANPDLRFSTLKFDSGIAGALAGGLTLVKDRMDPNAGVGENDANQDTVETFSSRVSKYAQQDVANAVAEKSMSGAFTASLENLYQKHLNKAEDLQYLPVLDQNGAINAAAGTQSYVVTKTGDGLNSVYEITKIEHPQDPSQADTRQYARYKVGQDGAITGFDFRDIDLANELEVSRAMQPLDRTAIHHVGRSDTYEFAKDQTQVLEDIVNKRQSVASSQASATKGLKDNLERLRRKYDQGKLRDLPDESGGRNSYEVALQDPSPANKQTATYTITKTHISEDGVPQGRETLTYAFDSRGAVKVADSHPVPAVMRPVTATKAGTAQGWKIEDPIVSKVETILSERQAAKSQKKSTQSFKAQLDRLLGKRNDAGRITVYDNAQDAAQRDDYYTMTDPGIDPVNETTTYTIMHHDSNGNIIDYSKYEFDRNGGLKGYKNGRQNDPMQRINLESPIVGHKHVSTEHSNFVKEILDSTSASNWTIAKREAANVRSNLSWSSSSNITHASTPADAPSQTVAPTISARGSGEKGSKEKSSWFSRKKQKGVDIVNETLGSLSFEQPSDKSHDIQDSLTSLQSETSDRRTVNRRRVSEEQKPGEKKDWGALIKEKMGGSKPLSTQEKTGKEEEKAHEESSSSSKWFGKTTEVSSDTSESTRTNKRVTRSTAPKYDSGFFKQYAQERNRKTPGNTPSDVGEVRHFESGKSSVGNYLRELSPGIQNTVC